MSKEYAYIVTGVTGCFEEQVKVGQKIIDKQYFGLNYTWKCVNNKTFEILGTITGKYDGKAIILAKL